MAASCGERSDSLRGEDLKDLRTRAEVGQKHLEGSLSEDIRLHGVVLEHTHAHTHTYANTFVFFSLSLCVGNVLFPEHSSVFCIFQPFLWGGEPMPTHFQLSSYLPGTSCRCCKKTEREQEMWHCTAEMNDCLPATYFFTGILPSLLVWREMRTYLRSKHAWLSVALLHGRQQSKQDVHSHFLQKDLSACVVPGSIVRKCNNVIGPVLMCV